MQNDVTLEKDFRGTRGKIKECSRLPRKHQNLLRFYKFLGTQMESEGDEAPVRLPKQRKLTSSARFSSALIQDSISPVPVLPPELINEILVKLPVKSLLKFRCVSKSWLDLISSPEFIKTHLNKSANNEDFIHHRLMLCFIRPKYNLKDFSVSSLLNGSVTEALDLEYPRKNSCRSVDIMGSVNGLVCLATSKKDLFIWNPSIRKFKNFPDCRDTSCFRRYFMYGFAFDEVHRDYKVVVGFRYDFSYLIKVTMYSLNDDSWTNVADLETRVICIKSGVFVNGKLLWANDIYHNSYSDIISFDLVEKTWGKVEQPYYGEGDFCWTLGVLESDLSVFCYYERPHADVWVLKEYGVKESWIKMFNIIIPCDLMIRHQFCLFFGMSNKGEILIQFGSTFMIYNPRDHSIVHRSPHLEITHYEYEASIYIESLVWPFSQWKKSRMQQQRKLK